jgi:hypothetical protein
MSSDVSVEHVASIFRVEWHGKQEIGMRQAANTACLRKGRITFNEPSYIPGERPPHQNLKSIVR